LRKARRVYPGCIAVALYQEPPRVTFWYEAPKPQRYWHESVKKGSKEQLEAEAQAKWELMKERFRRDMYLPTKPPLVEEEFTSIHEKNIRMNMRSGKMDRFEDGWP
jgi:hypothetical protein